MRSIIFSLIAVAACADHSPPPSAPADTAPARHRVELAVAKDGVALGRVRIVEGEPATLELAGDGPAAAELKEQFDAAIAKGWFGVDVHETTPEGGRGALATRMYRPSDRDYAKGVEYWLEYEHNLDVTVAP